jgi:predicted regulator of Ras-like GTPase activity (Roadblock/LC7/MglB family)
MTRVEQLNRVLRALQSGSPDLEACALISEDGLVIASALPQHIQEMRIAGMAATLLSLGERAAHELVRGKLQQVLIRGDEGYVVMTRAATGTLLLALTTKDAKLGLVFYDMDHAAAEIRKIL